MAQPEGPQAPPIPKGAQDPPYPQAPPALIHIKCCKYHNNPYHICCHCIGHTLSQNFLENQTKMQKHIYAG